MSEQPSPALTALLARITTPETTDSVVDERLTGELGALAQWWQDRAGATPPVAVVVPCGAGGIDDGVAAADRAIDAGATLLVPRVTTRDDLAARTLIALLTRREASSVVHQPTGLADREWMDRVAAVRDRSADAVDRRGEPAALVEDLGSAGIASAAGVLLAAAARRTPCLVDGTDELAAALVADRLAYRAKGWWRAASDSPDPGRAAAIDRIDLAPGLPLHLADDAGLGADATIALLAVVIDGGD